VACVVYLIVAIGIVKVFQIVKPTNPHEVDQEVDDQ
jgi:hypothetical protein